MKEPKFISKEELVRRQEIIDKDKIELERLRDIRNNITKRLANVNFDLERSHSDKFRVEQERLTNELKEVKDKIDYYSGDVAESTKILRQDKKDYSTWNRYQRQKELQDRTLPTATRDNLDWTLDERDILSVVDHSDDEEMVATAIDLNRTYYGCDIEWRRLKGVTKRS